MSKNVNIVKIPDTYCQITLQKDSNNLRYFELGLRELVLLHPYHGFFHMGLIILKYSLFPEVPS